MLVHLYPFLSYTLITNTPLFRERPFTLYRYSTEARVEVSTDLMDQASHKMNLTRINISHILQNEIPEYTKYSTEYYVTKIKDRLEAPKMGEPGELN